MLPAGRGVISPWRDEARFPLGGGTRAGPRSLLDLGGWVWQRQPSMEEVTVGAQ